ncbi:2Fe-2S iron-sulfur cluster-binding protein [Candidatus Omnitrophota bacterium]
MKTNKMIKITIDDRQVEVASGATILEVANSLGIDIPTLCHHEALEPYGACRVCQVEIVTPRRSSVITACTYPVWDGLIIKTESEKAKTARKFVVELLLARCPNSERIQKLAKDMGVEAKRLKSANEKEECVLCGLCVRACKDIICKSAISFVSRGADRKIDTPFAEHSEDCIGCGACAFVCPTGAIKMEDILKVRKIHDRKTELELAGCKCCGARFATIKELDHLKGKIDILQDIFELCENCRRKKLKEKISKVEGACQR